MPDIGLPDKTDAPLGAAGASTLPTMSIRFRVFFGQSDQFRHDPEGGEICLDSSLA